MRSGFLSRLRRCFLVGKCEDWSRADKKPNYYSYRKSCTRWNRSKTYHLLMQNIHIQTHTCLSETAEMQGYKLVSCIFSQSKAVPVNAESRKVLFSFQWKIGALLKWQKLQRDDLNLLENKYIREWSWRICPGIGFLLAAMKIQMKCANNRIEELLISWFDRIHLQTSSRTADILFFSPHLEPSVFGPVPNCAN